MKLAQPFICVLLLLASACAADSSADISGLDHDRSGDSIDVVCDPSRQVAYASEPGACDDHGNWAAQMLFPGASGDLARYCKYTFTSGGAKGSDVSWLETQVPSATLAADCRVVSPQEDQIFDTVGDELDTFFGWMVGRLESGELAGAYPGVTQSPVVVAVVDTFPNAEPQEPRSDHGPIMMSLVESIACADAPCPISVEAHLGMPRTHSGIDTTNGGYLGLQSDVAQGIRAAVDDNPGARLVINLSLGWEADQFGGSSAADMPPPVRSVYDALGYARCHGALIIAAAGNASGLVDDEFAMAPGRWEGSPAPTGAQCVALGLDPNEVHIDSGSYTPLVHAVGGLYGPSSEMATSREFGMPRLAAAGSHAVAHDRGAGMDGSAVRTGTSVATAVASAAASLVWSLDPNLSPSEVMGVLYSSGAVTGLTSDFGGPVRRVHVCRAVEDVLGPGPLDCDAPPSVTVSDIAAELSLHGVTHVPSFDPPLPCGGETFHPAPGESRVCDELERDPWAWLVSPQPPRPGCTDCVLTNTTTDKPTAVLSLNDDFSTDTLVTADIVVTEASGAVQRFSLSETDINSGAVVVPNLRTDEISHYELPIDLGGAAPLRAMLYMDFASGAETEDALLIE